MRTKSGLSALAALAVLAATAAALPPAEKLTVDGLFSPELTTGLRTPLTHWLDSGRVLLYDVRVDAAQRIIETFDPETKVRKPAFDRDAFLDGLGGILGKAAPESVPWPLDFSSSGDLLLYEMDGDILVWETPAKRWRRLTSTAAEETSAALSPDGRWAGFTRGSDLYAVELASRTETRLTTGGSETLLNGPLSWVYWEEIYEHARVPYAWSPDSRAIAYLRSDDSGVAVSTFVNFEPATQAVVRQRYPKAGQANPRVRLGIVEAATALTTWVETGDDEYIARFQWLPDGRTIAVQTLNRDQNRLRLFFSDRATGRSRLILEENQPAWINLNNALTFLEGGKRFLWLSERDGYQHLYLYAADGTLVRQVTKGEFMVVSAGGDVCNRNKGLVAVDEKAGWLYFSSNKDALPERHLFRVRLDGSGLERLSVEPGIHAASFSPTGKYYLDDHQSSQTPPELKLYSAAGRLAAVISPSLTGLFGRFGLGKTELMTYRTEDGIDLTLKITKPGDFDPVRRYPALIYVYGGPGSQEVLDDWPRMLWDDLMAQEGYIAFSVEVRAGQNKNKALETSVHRRGYGMQNVKDIRAAVGRLRKFPYVDGGRIGIWGGSGGGCTTLYTMTHSDLFKAGISLYPVSDWHYYDTIYTERYQDRPQDNPDGYAETSSVLAAKNLHGRLLIAHGTYDDNVHPQNTEAFIHELIAADIGG